MKILIIEDHLISQMGVMEIIRENFSVSKFFTSTHTEIEETYFQLPGVDLIIFGTGNDDQVNSATWALIAQRRATVPVVVYCIKIEYYQLLKFLMEGAMAVIFKKQDSADFLKSVKDVLNGDRYINHEALMMIAERTISDGDTSQQELTPRELLIASQLSMGKKTSEIAIKFGLSPSFVSTAKGKIFAKLKVENILELSEVMNDKAITDLGR